jgi:hypothetical protein
LDPFGHRRLPPRDLGYDILAEGVEGLDLDGIGARQIREAGCDAGSEFLGHRAVEGEEKDLLGLGQALAKGVSHASDHRRRLARSGGGDHLHGVVHADAGVDLLVGERIALDGVEEGLQPLLLLRSEGGVVLLELRGELDLRQLV